MSEQLTTYLFKHSSYLYHLDISAAADRIRELKQAINNHNNAYYVLNAPRISDFAYDLLVQELLGLERKYPELATDDSPSQHVGSDLSASVTSFHKVRHKVPMLS